MTTGKKDLTIICAISPGQKQNSVAALLTLMSKLPQGYAIGYYDSIKHLVSIHPQDLTKASRDLQIPLIDVLKISRLYRIGENKYLSQELNRYISKGNLIERTIEFK
jgi:hypothetical protein